MHKKEYKYSTCELALAEYPSSFLFIKTISVSMNIEKGRNSSEVCNIYLVTNNVNNDTLNLIDVKPQLSEKELLECSKNSLLIFKPAERGICINFISYFDINGVIRKKYPIIVGQAFSFTR